MRPVIITTEHRGVFFGYTDNAKEDTVVTLKNARCAIRWATTGGFMELADIGPNENSKIGSRAEEITLQKVTSMTKVSDRAVEAWERA